MLTAPKRALRVHSLYARMACAASLLVGLLLPSSAAAKGEGTLQEIRDAWSQTQTVCPSFALTWDEHVNVPVETQDAILREFKAAGRTAEKGPSRWTKHKEFKMDDTARMLLRHDSEAGLQEHLFFFDGRAHWYLREAQSEAPPIGMTSEQQNTWRSSPLMPVLLALRPGGHQQAGLAFDREKLVVGALDGSSGYVVLSCRDGGVRHELKVDRTKGYLPVDYERRGDKSNDLLLKITLSYQRTSAGIFAPALWSIEEPVEHGAITTIGEVTSFSASTPSLGEYKFKFPANTLVRDDAGVVVADVGSQFGGLRATVWVLAPIVAMLLLWFSIRAYSRSNE